MVFRVILIDDEPWTIIDMKKTFRWLEMGFEIVAETCSANEALDIILRIKPEVVFTDIRMPRMSGIELMKKARENGVDSEFIIVSGFAEFSYAQEAIKYGAFEYCLKPVNPEKANEILERLSKYLREKKAASGSTDMGQPVHNPPEVQEEQNGNFEKMLEYIKVHFHKKLQLKELSKEFFINPTYCCLLFNKNLGKTFSEFLTDIRMKEAARLLSDKNLTVDEVSKKAGYDDYFYFNKVFKKYYGLTPSEFRRSRIKLQ